MCFSVWNRCEGSWIIQGHYPVDYMKPTIKIILTVLERRVKIDLMSGFCPWLPVLCQEVVIQYWWRLVYKYVCVNSCGGNTGEIQSFAHNLCVEIQSSFFRKKYSTCCFTVIGKNVFYGIVSIYCLHFVEPSLNPMSLKIQHIFHLKLAWNLMLFIAALFQTAFVDFEPIGQHASTDSREEKTHYPSSIHY